MAILNHGSTIRTADGGESTTTIVTASNIGTYGVAANSTYYIGTTQNIFNRASGAQTLTGVSIDGNAATVTNGVYTTGTQTIGGAKTFSDGITVNTATYNRFTKPSPSTYQTVALFGSTSGGLFLTTDNPIIGVGAYYNTSWIATATSGRQIDFAGGNFTFGAFSGATVGGAASWGTVAQLSSAGVFSATGDFRAPIFYDRNNTSYYLDAANTGTSLLVAGNVGIGTTSPGAKLVILGETQISSNAAYTTHFNYNDVGTNFITTANTGFTYFRGSSNGLTIMTVAGSGNVGIGATSPAYKLDVSGTGFASGDFRAPIFYDSNDTAYYVDPNSVSRLASLRVYSAFDTASSDVYANMRVMRNNATTDGMYIGYGNSGSTSALTRIFGGGATTGELSKYSNYTLEPGSFRSPIFYDSDNTSYYIDAASTSNLVGLTVANTITGSISGNAATATILQTARNINGTSFNGSAAITTATWGTARTLTIGSTGKSVDGSAGVSWSLAEIGAAATNQTMFIGTTSVAINRASASQTLTGVSIDGNAANITAYTVNQNVGTGNSPSFVRLTSTQSTGTSPFVVSSTTVVNNLNSDLLDGRHGSYYQDPANLALQTSWTIPIQTANSVAGFLYGTFGDALAFRTISNLQYWDGSAWQAYSNPNIQNILTGNIQGSSATVTPTNRKFRFEFTAPGTYLGGGVLVVHQTWNIGAHQVSSMLEYYNGTSWITAITERSSGSGEGNYHFYNRGDIHGDWTQYRITITSVDTVNSTTYTSIQLLYDYTRSGLPNNFLPITWDYAKNVTTTGSLRTPIFYDSNNTAYYLDAGNTGTSLALAGNAGVGTASPTLSSGKGVHINSSSGHANLKLQSSGRTWELLSATGAYFSIYDTTGGADRLVVKSDGNVGIGTTSPSQKLHVVGTGFASTDFRAPIFYDSNDTTYYIDAASTSRLNTINVGASGIIINNASTAAERNLKIKATGSNPGVGIALYDSSDNFRVQLYGEASNYGFLDGLWAGWDLRKTIDGNLYLNDSTTYYLNTVSTSALYDLTLIGTKHTYLYINPGNGYEAMVRYNGGSGSGWYVGKRTTSQLVGTESFHFYSEAAGATVGGIDTSGSLFSTGSMRSPIFYDQNNTAYYCDPASTSVLNKLTIDGGNYANNYFQSLSNFVNGTLVTTDIPATAANGLSFVMNVVGKSYNTTTSPFNFSVQGYLYNSTIINYSGLSLDSTGLTTIKIFENGGFLCFWWARVSYWNAFEVSVRSYDTAKTNYNRVTNITDVVEPTGTKKVTVTLQSFLRADVSATNAVDLRAPRFYDSNDTTYYIDPANGGFNLRGGNSNRVTFNSGDSGIIVTNAEGVSSNVRLGCAWGRPGIYNGSSITVGAETTIDFVIANAVKAYIDSSSNLFSNGSVRSPIFYDSNNTAYYLDPASTSNLNALTVAGGNATIYRDLIVNGGASGNFGNRIIVQGTATTYTLQDTNVRPTVYLTGAYPVITLNHTVTGNTNHGPTIQFAFNGLTTGGSTSRQILIGTSGDGNCLDFGFSGGGYGGNPDYNPHNGIAGYSGVTPMRLFSNGLLLGSTGAYPNNIKSTSFALDVRGTGYSNTDFRAPIFYDSANTAYYVDPAGTSNLNALVLSGASYFRPQTWIQMDGSYGMYWPNTNGCHIEGNTLSSYGSLAIRGTRGSWKGIHFYEGGNVPHLMFDGSANGGVYFETGGRWASYYSYGNNCWGFGTSTTNSAYNLYVPTGVYSGGRVDGTIFYDSNNTAYYIDAASTSNLNGLNIVDGNLELYKSQTVDMSNTTTYSTSNYYPVTISVPTEGCIIQIQNNLNSNVPSWSTHAAGFTLNLKWRTNGSGWGTTQVRRYIEQYFEQFTNQTICGGITQMSNSSIEVVWLRGGGRYYFKFSRNLSATAQAVAYTINSQTVTPGSTAQNTIWNAYSGYSILYNNQTVSTDNMYTPVLYDWNNSAYYVDPASTSNLVGLTVANTITGSITGNAGGSSASCTGNAATATILQTARNINGTSFNGSAAITTATWGTARTITIGSTGKSVDGSANVSWSLAELGAAATNQTMFIGTTSVAINRSSASQTLTGISIDGSSASCTGNAATVTNGVYTNTNNTLTGINTINNTSNTVINNQSGNLGLTMYQATAGTDAYMTFHIGGDYAAYLGLGGAENDLVYGGWSAGNNRRRILHSGNAAYAWNMNQYVRTTDNVTHNIVDATQFRDSANTAYYVDPASTSNLVGLTVANTITGSVSGSSGSCTGNSATATTATNAGCVTSDTGNVGDSRLQYWQTSGNTTLNPDTEWYNAIRMGHGNPVTYYSNTLAVKMTGSNLGDIYTRTTTNGTAGTWNRFWNNNNDGAGSGLDADLLDGINSASFLRSDASATNSVDLRSPIFYDSNNTAFYIDAASTSILNLVRTRNTFGERIALNSASPQTINTQYNVTELTLTSSILTLTFSNIQASGIVHMWTLVTVGNATVYTITWPAAVKWPGGTAPTLTTTSGKRDIYQFVTYDGGTNIYAIIVGQNL